MKRNEIFNDTPGIGRRKMRYCHAIVSDVSEGEGPNGIRRILGGISSVRISDEGFKNLQQKAQGLGFSAVKRVWVEPGEIVEVMVPPLEQMSTRERHILFKSDVHSCD